MYVATRHSIGREGGQSSEEGLSGCGIGELGLDEGHGTTDFHGLQIVVRAMGKVRQAGHQEN
jgi:hypothetical protein